MDFGSGTGRFIPFIFEFCSGIISTDVSRVGLSLIENSYSFILGEQLKVVVNSEGDSLPFDDCQFDVVFSFYTLFHARADLIEFYLREICRCLKSGGVFVAIEPFFKKTKLPQSNRCEYINYVSSYDFSNMLDWAEFKDDDYWYCYVR